MSVAKLPVTALTLVGATLGERLASSGLGRIFDVLLHLPRGYEDREHIVPMAQLTHGQRCVVYGQVASVSDRRGLSVRLKDDTGELELKFFRTYPTLIQTMQVGVWLYVFGEVRISQYGIQMSHPEYRKKGFDGGGLLPIYPAPKAIHQNKIRQLIRAALLAVDDNLPTFDEILRQKPLGLGQLGVDMPLLDALRQIHEPSYPPSADHHTKKHLCDTLQERRHLAYQRLILEELAVHQLTFRLRRSRVFLQQAPKCQKISPLAVRLLERLPFYPTAAQKRVLEEIVADLSGRQPMLRLVQGDVGSGKTLVAALAACHVIDSGWQVALLAPTEILAQQHHQNLTAWFAPLGVAVGLLVGKQSDKERQKMLDDIAHYRMPLVVGTHALFQDKVSFAKLALVIVDEQHRFGVEQRLKLAAKAVANCTPHQLNMTATPIPRTLAMGLYGDMDVSVIDELPPGRTPVTTVTVSRDRRDEVLARVAKNCQEGKQAYWICPLVEEGGDNIQSAEQMYKDIVQALPIRVGLVHGKMPPKQKQAVMQAFKEHCIDLLLATTVVEVGVDVPNASLMVIENAERLGLSQLHQLRGRVGRGSTQSFCVLLYQLPLSSMGIARLNTLKDSNDGFVIAEHDLALRGAGELLGKRQTGDMGYYVADLAKDEHLLELACEMATALVASGDEERIEALLSLWLPSAKDYVGV